MKISKQKQIETAESLDGLLVLGGERNFSRSEHTAFLYNNVISSRQSPLHLVLSGGYGGLHNKEDYTESEAEQMRKYLIKEYIPLENMSLEEKSKDTISNMVFCQPIFKQMGLKKIGLVTDNYKLKRDMWVANRVLGDSYDISPCPTDISGTFFERRTQEALSLINALDLTGIESGNQETFEKYIKEKHPMFAENPDFSFMKLAMKIFNLTDGKGFAIPYKTR